MEDLLREYGGMFARAYRMNLPAFHKLLEAIRDRLESKEGPSFQGHVPNGAIAPEIRLAIALRWFAGGSYIDIMISHGVSKSEVYKSVWMVVEAVNNTETLAMRFPETEEEMKAIAAEFSSRSSAGFSNCIGCIDGVLVWIEKPSNEECEKVGVESGKFYCGRKGKYGLNLQAVCDARRRFIDVSVRMPASSSDYLSFVTSGLYGRLTDLGRLLRGYCLYGDNAYANSIFMAVPFPNTSGGPQDAYNFFHSQVRINIECAFGILTNRWRLLKSPLSSSIPIERVSALISCLCRLHNFCIDNGQSTVPSRYEHDRLTLMDFQYSDESNPADRRPLGLLGGGDHFDDIGGGRRGARRRAQGLNAEGDTLPRATMLAHVIERDIHRPAPMSRRRGS